MKSLYIIKLGSESIYNFSQIGNQISEYSSKGNKVLVVCGGNLGIKKRYEFLGKDISYLTLKNNDKVRYCHQEEMEYLIEGYRDYIFPQLKKELEKRRLSSFIANGFYSDLVLGKKIRPLLTLKNGRKHVVRDQCVGTVEKVRKDVINGLLDSYDIVCLSAPIGNIDNPLEVLNIDADFLAAQLCEHLQAHHIRFVTGTAGLLENLNNPSSTISNIYLDTSVKKYVKGKMKQKVRAAEWARDKSSADIQICGPHNLGDKASKSFFWPFKKGTDLSEDLLGKAISICSVSKDEGELAYFLKNHISSPEINTKIDKVGNLIATKGEGEKKLLLLGHMDTVPFTWPVKKDNNHFYGRGSVDAKSCLINFISVLKEVEVPAGIQLIVAGAVEEEISSSKGAFFLRDYLTHIHSVVIGEPSGVNSLTVGYFGLFKIKIKVSVRHGHSAGKDIISAPDKIIGISEILRDHVSKIDPDSISSLTQISSHSDVKYFNANAILNFRISPNGNIVSLRKILNKIKEEEEVSLEILRLTPGVSYRRSTLIARAFNKSFISHSIRARFLIKKGTSDMNTLATKWQIPMVAYGPGDSSLDHTNREKIDLEEFKKSRSILKKMIQEWIQMVKQTGKVS